MLMVMLEVVGVSGVVGNTRVVNRRALSVTPVLLEDSPVLPGALLTLADATTASATLRCYASQTGGSKMGGVENGWELLSPTYVLDLYLLCLAS